jgi:hypothetical protein
MLNEAIAQRLAEGAASAASSPAGQSTAGSARPARGCFEDTLGDGDPSRYVGMSGEDGGSRYQHAEEEDAPGVEWARTGLLVVPGRAGDSASGHGVGKYAMC